MSIQAASESLLNLSEVTQQGAGVSPSKQPFCPPVPSCLEDSGLSSSLVEQLLLKTLHFRGDMVGRDIAASLGFRFSIIEPLLELQRRQRLVEVKASLGFGSVSAVYALTEQGRTRAREFSENNQYFGHAPVPMEQYVAAVRAQRLENGWLSRPALEECYRHMVVTPQVINQVGPAINSGKSLLIYGKPGNGKTYLAEALFHLDSQPIYVPYTIEYQGQIIKLFDPVYHIPVNGEESEFSSLAFEPKHDGRWVLCKRPFIVTGGELSLDMLDLTYIETAKIYDAPFQLKANNGIYLIDDFGRQRCSPAEVLNRWIVPMDRRVDFLRFATGGKVEVPFETFLIFSTNLKTREIGDEAFLRRIQYKMHVFDPEIDEFRQIFDGYCQRVGLDCTPELRDRFIHKHYTQSGKAFRRCQPRDVISHAIDLLNFDRLPMKLNEDILDDAFDSCFVVADPD